MKFRYTLILHLLLYVALCSTAFAQNVAIPDANLRNAIREALKLPAGAPITQADMRELTELEARHSQIANLTGLEYAMNLSVLKLYANPFEDISPLANLTQLIELHLSGGQIVDISPLANLTQLTFLRVNENWVIEDISPLEGLTQLRVAHLDHNAIVDISPLAGLTKLEELDLRYNRIIDVSPLKNLTQLTALYLNNNRIVDVSPLEDLPNLEHLDTHNNPIFDPDSPLVEIPDPNLRTAIREALNIPDGIPLSEAYMRQLTRLDVGNRQITALTGLEHALNLTELNLAGNNINDLVPIVKPLAQLMHLTALHLGGNQIEEVGPLADLIQLTFLRLNDNLRIEDISPLTNLIQLRVVHLDRNAIVDISPLSRLTNLEIIDLRRNRVVNVRPLSNLTQLTTLYLYSNRIVDVRPLATLTRLEVLDIRENRITDHSPLDGLSLADFRYDQTCDMPPLPLAPRLANRDYPNVAGANWIFGQDPRIDLIYGNHLFQMHPRPDGRLTGDVERALEGRDDYIAVNPNAVFLMALNEMNAPAIDYWGADWPYWVRDSDGNIVFDIPFTEGGRTPGGLVDFTQPEVQDIIVQQAISISKCGLYDGIIIDGWREDIDSLKGYVSIEAQFQARLNIVRRIREATRPNFLIQVNSNYEILPHTGRYINGLSMETGIPISGHTPAEREQIVTEVEKTVVWAEENMREPRINAIFGQAFRPDEQPRSANLQWVRLLTTLSLTHADGYAMIQHLGLPIGDDRHWHDFWDADLGQPVSGKRQLYREIDGLYIREFTKGWGVYNHSGKPQVITLPEEVQGVASGMVGVEHTLPNLDGEMYLRVKPVNPADVNGDGAVNILDLVAVAQGLGTGKMEADVNGDGVVNVFDLVQVAGAIGGGGAAPSASSLDPSIISAADVERWLTDAQGLGVGDANLQRGIRFLEGLLAALAPKETALLPNYPNPFNPETWIPYRLAREAEVVITIYDTKGTPVRRLALGNQAAGYYAERGRAAYWDGRNEDGEAVANGIYIYQFLAGDYAASRRMVIVK